MLEMLILVNSAIIFKRIAPKIENVIIDLSYNTGGDERLGKQPIWYLTENKPLDSRNTSIILNILNTS
jgi:hypothetical protein